MSSIPDPIGYFYPGSLSNSPSGPVICPAKAITQSYAYVVPLLGSFFDNLALILQVSTNGFVLAKLNGTLAVKVGNLPITVNYEQDLVHMFLLNSSFVPIKPPPGLTLPQW